jgi:hypothetical protein
MNQINQNKYNALVKDEIIGMLMIEGCDSEGLKNHLKNEYKINGKIDCYPTTSSKAADLIDSYIEVSGNNNNKTQKSTGNDNDDEQIAGIHATDEDEKLDQDELKSEEEPDYTMIAALAAVQDGGHKDPNNYSPLEVDDIDFDIDFDREEVAGIHVAVEVESECKSDSESSSYHLSDHYYCPSNDNGYSTSSDEDESSIDSNMPGLQQREAEFSSSSEDEDTIASDDNNNNDDHGDASIQGSISGDCTNGIALDAFDRHNTVTLSTLTSTHTIPPVSCVVIPNDGNEVNSSTAAPIIARVNPAGQLPIRVQQDCFAHVNDVICHKPSLLNIDGEPIDNWAQFVDKIK